MEAQGPKIVRAGMKLTQGDDFPAQLTQKPFTAALNPIPPSPGPWATRQRLLPMDEVRMRQCDLGELRGLAAVPRPAIGACLARVAARVTLLQGSGINLSKLVKA